VKREVIVDRKKGDQLGRRPIRKIMIVRSQGMNRKEIPCYSACSIHYVVFLC